MNKRTVDFVTKVSLCGILVLIFIVLFNIIQEPYSIQSSGFQSEKEVKEAMQNTRRVGRELDKNFMDDYVDTLETPKTKTPVKKKHNYYVALPKEYSVVNYENQAGTHNLKKKH